MWEHKKRAIGQWKRKGESGGEAGRPQELGKDIRRSETSQTGRFSCYEGLGYAQKISRSGREPNQEVSLSLYALRRKKAGHSCCRLHW